MARISFTLKTNVGSDPNYAGSFLQPGSANIYGDDGSALKADGYVTTPATAMGTSSYISAMPTDYNKVLLEWGISSTLAATASATPAVTALTICYSFTGPPQTLPEGVRLPLEITASNSSSSYSHTDLPSGKWVYYTIFAKYESTGYRSWYEKVASTEVLVPKDYGYSDTLFRRIPLHYRLQDEQIGLTNLLSPNLGDLPESLRVAGPLQRMLDVFGWEVNVIKTIIDYVITQKDPFVANSEMIEKLAVEIGVPLTVADLGTTKLRELVADFTYLTQNEGLLTGVQEYITAIAGCDTIVNTSQADLLTSGTSSHHAMSSVLLSTSASAVPATNQWLLESSASAYTMTAASVYPYSNMFTTTKALAITRTSGSVITGATYTIYGTTQYTTSTAHGFSVGDTVIVAGITPSSFNTTRVIAGINSSTSFYFAVFNGSTGGTYVSGGTVQGPQQACLKTKVQSVSQASRLYMDFGATYTGLGASVVGCWLGTSVQAASVVSYAPSTGASTTLDNFVAVETNGSTSSFEWPITFGVCGNGEVTTTDMYLHIWISSQPANTGTLYLIPTKVTTLNKYPYYIDVYSRRLNLIRDPQFAVAAPSTSSQATSTAAYWRVRTTTGTVSSAAVNKVFTATPSASASVTLSTDVTNSSTGMQYTPIGRSYVYFLSIDDHNDNIVQVSIKNLDGSITLASAATPDIQASLGGTAKRKYWRLEILDGYPWYPTNSYNCHLEITAAVTATTPLKVGRPLFEPSAPNEYFDGNSDNGGWLGGSDAGGANADYRWGGATAHTSFSYYTADYRRVVEATKRMIPYIVPVTETTYALTNLRFDRIPGYTGGGQP